MPSASVILDDPNLLFVNAGMVQFVPVLPRRSAPRRGTARPASRSASAPRTSTRSASPPGTTPSSRWRATSRFGDYFKKRRHRAGLDAADQPGRPGRLRIRSRKALGDGLSRRRRGRSDLWQEVAGLPAERIQRRGMADNYWSMGIPGPCGPSLGDLLRPRTRVRHRGRPGGQRGPLHRDLESRVHAERARRGHLQGRLRDPRAAAAQEHRHRHGRRAGRLPAAGRGQRLRDRPAAPRHRPGRRHRPARLRRRATTTTTSATGSSPTTAAPRRSSSATASAPATRAAATCCAGCCAASSAPPNCSASSSPIMARPDGHGARRDGTVVSRTGHRLRPHPPHRGGRGDRVQPHAGVGVAAVRRGRRARPGPPARRCCPAPTRSPCTTPTASRSN